MLSLDACKKILQQKGVKYNDEQVKEIREMLYKLGRIDFMNYKQKKLTDEKSNHLHKG